MSMYSLLAFASYVSNIKSLLHYPIYLWNLCKIALNVFPFKTRAQFSRKEVFQPHLPVRLPCYDLAPVTRFTLGRSSRSRTSGTPNFHGLTGGVYKARERIHRVMADTRLLANPTSRSRVADSDPNWDRLSRFAPHRWVAALCTDHCSTCVALDVRAVLIWRHPHLPRGLRRQST